MVGGGDGAQGSEIRYTLRLINSEPTAKPGSSLCVWGHAAQPKMTPAGAATCENVPGSLSVVVNVLLFRKHCLLVISKSFSIV